MPRATNNVASRRRRKKILKQAKGYRGARSKLIRTASDAVDRAGQYAYRDRRQKKRTFRALWITRINAAARENGISYSKLISGLNKAGVEVNRKVLADLAVTSPDAFKALVETANAA
ncbi:50S ribosomal protein L20 [bacterium]|jgi:large subunit ribosomal protein L20|nr:50S ribosomal protein L20 [bacterium]HCK09294.1 50S ribosomal protein L20 [Candidatus Latescibacterota bacterium]